MAREASSENLPQISIAVLRTDIEHENDPAKRTELIRRLVALLVSGRRFDEALALSTTGDAGKDQILSFWKATALMGTGDFRSAKDIYASLLNSKEPVAGISNDQVVLSLAQALRGSNDPAAALVLIEKIPPESLFAEDAALERGADLLLLGRSEECIKLTQSPVFSSSEGKAAAAYLKALAVWRSGNQTEAKKLFDAVPPATPWISSAATLGAALSLSASTKYLHAIDLLEKHLDASDEIPLLEDQFKLLDNLYAAAATPDTTTFKKWAEDSSKTTRAKLAAYYQAKNELRLKHAELAESLLDSFIRKYPDDRMADRARLLLSASRLQRGLAEDAMGWANDRPAAPDRVRARLAYLRGLAAAAAKRMDIAKAAFQSALSLDSSLAENALFNKAVLIATTDKGTLDVSQAAREIVEMNSGTASEEMKFQIALDLARRGQTSGMAELGQVAEQSSDQKLKARARLATAELNMKSGHGDVANSELAKAVHENSGDPEREEYLNVFLKDTGRKSDSVAVIAAARAFITAHLESRYVPEVRLKLADSLLSSGDIQGARIEFEQLAASGIGTDFGRRALFLAAQSAARAMDPSSIDASLMLLERVAETGTNDQLVWQARLQEGTLKNAQNLPLEALAIYDKILSSRDSRYQQGPDAELCAAALMAKGDTLHQLGAKDPSNEQEAVKTWEQLATDPSMSLRWRNQALCKSALVLEKLGENDAALASYFQAFKNPRTTEPEQLWHDKAAFEAARLLENRKQWNDAVSLYGQILAEGGPRADEAKARLAKLRLENFLWEN